MKIALVGAYPSDPARLEGGVHAVITYLIEGILREVDAEIHVVTGVSPGKDTSVRRADGIWVHPVAWSRFKRLTFHRRDVVRMQEVLRGIQPDVVHGQGPPAPYAATTLGSEFPHVVTWHGVLFREAAVVPGLSARLVYALDIMFERYCWRRMREVVAISPYVEREYHSMTEARFHLIENPIADRFFGIKGEGEPNVILCAARLIPRKDILMLLRAVALLRQDRPDVQLHVAGETGSEPDYAARCFDYVAKEGLEGTVRFLGQLTEDEILAEYGRCAVVALSSRQETAPMAVEQAMAASRVVVSTPAGGAPWLVQHGVTGLLVPFGDAGRMAMALRRLLDDASLRQWMGERGHEQAQARFHSTVVARRTVGLYRQLMKRGRGMSR